MKGVAWGEENASIPLQFPRHILADKDTNCHDVYFKEMRLMHVSMLCHKQTIKCLK